MNLPNLLENRGYKLKAEGGGNFRVLGKGGLIVKGQNWYWHSEGLGGRDPMTLLAHLGESYDGMSSLVNDESKTVSVIKSMLDVGTDPLSPMGRSYLLRRGIEPDLIDHVTRMNLVRDGPKGFLAFLGYDDFGKIRCISQRAYNQTRKILRYDRKGSDKQWTFSLRSTGNSTVIVVEGPIDALSIACLENQKHHRGYFETTKIATCGSSASNVVNRLRRMNPERVIIAMDLDPPGHNMSESLIQACSRLGVTTVVVNKENGKDPNEWLLNRPT